MSPPEDLDRLSQAELKGLVVCQAMGATRGAAAHGYGAAGRDCATERRAGAAEHQAEWHGAGVRAEGAGKLRRPKRPARQHAFEAHGRRGTDRQGSDAAIGVPLQRLHELRGAGSGDPFACRGFPLRALAAAGWQHADGDAAGRHQRSLRGRNCAGSCWPNTIKARRRCRDW
jgi:hypothetical protein